MVHNTRICSLQMKAEVSAISLKILYSKSYFNRTIIQIHLLFKHAVNPALKYLSYIISDQLMKKSNLQLFQ